jgi:hypothetical protein
MRLSNALFLTAGLALIIVGSPVISAVLAMVIAAFANCSINEGIVQPCILWGRDIGPALYRMFTAFWLFIFTLYYLPVVVAVVVAGGWVRFRESRKPDTIRQVGAVYWIVVASTLMLPLSLLMVIGLVVAGGLVAWRHFSGQGEANG